MFEDHLVYQKLLETLSDVESNIFAAHCLYCEVMNNGFYNFYTNLYGMVAPEAERAFRVIGMPRTASIIKNTMKLFQKINIRQKEARVKRISGKKLRKIRQYFQGEDENFLRLATTEKGGFYQAADLYLLKNFTKLSRDLQEIVEEEYLENIKSNYLLNNNFVG
jgi:hypothetical protein